MGRTVKMKRLTKAACAGLILDARIREAQARRMRKESREGHAEEVRAILFNDIYRESALVRHLKKRDSARRRR